MLPPSSALAFLCDCPSQRRFGLCCRLLLVARGQVWSPASHVNWPDAFKAAVRCLLLTANSKAGGGKGSVARRSERRRRGKAPRLAGAVAASSAGLHSLPQELLLKIVGLAAEPMSRWL